MKNKHTIPWNLITDKLTNELSDEDSVKFSLWIKQKENRELFANISLLWKEVRQYCSDYTPDKESCWKELSRRLNWDENGPRARKPRFAFRKYAAIAASLLLLIGFSFYMGKSGHPSESKDTAFVQTYKNMSGKSKLILPDGTLVWLHDRSELTSDTQYGASDRKVKLNGEAYFEVVSNSKKPFIVYAGEVDVKVHGTKFNVEAFSDQEDISISLLEGLVSLNTPTGNCFLSPGETGIYNRRSNKLSVSKSDVAFVSSWTRDQLVFTNQPLGEIARFLSKWYGVEIHVDSQRAQQHAYTFTLRNEPLEEILRLMIRIHPFTYRFDDQNNLYINP